MRARVVHRAGWIVFALACSAPEPALAPAHTGPPARRWAAARDPVLEKASRFLERGDVAAARKALEEERWLADDRARATLLLFGCLLVEGRYADGIDILREYLEKTPRLKTGRDLIAARLLRHHATGGGLSAESAEEACYFGLYALKALKEAETARPDLEFARREAPLPERYLAEIVRP